MTAVKDRVFGLPLVRRIRARRYERWFRTSTSDFPVRGVYATPAEARAAAPPDKPTGYDTQGADGVYLEEMSRMAPSDYPVVHWLAPLVRPGTVLFDYGGHVGTKYRAFARFVAYPPAFRWLVFDVAHVVAAGRRLASPQAHPHLAFTTALHDADGTDVLLASGSLQYAEEPLWQVLDALQRPPAHVLVNRLPWHDGPAFVTVQNIHVAYVPYVAFERAAFLREMAARGYVPVDEWEVLDRHTHIPFRPDLAVHHAGWYFRRHSAQHSAQASPG